MSAYPEALPHGELQAVFPDLFLVTGTSRPTFQGTTWQFSRNMVVVRDGSALTLINTVRLDDAGLKALEALGTVVNVVRIGAFHGLDDAFYVDRYKAKLWALSGMTHESGKTTDVELVVGGPMPFPGCALFVYETAAQPEGLLVLDRDGGIVVSCDSLQNWAQADKFFSAESSEKMAAIGFIREANIGPGWRQGSNVKGEDFARLKRLAFKHLLPAHGTPLLNVAHEKLSATFLEQFNV